MAKKKRKRTINENKNYAKKVIKQTLLDSKGVRGYRTYTPTPKNKVMNRLHSVPGMRSTHTQTRAKAVLKNIKSRIAKRGAAKSKKR